jgi:hypothetical protein
MMTAEYRVKTIAKFGFTEREARLRGVNYFCRLPTTISAGEELAKECRPPPGGSRLLSSAGRWPCRSAPERRQARRRPQSSRTSHASKEPGGPKVPGS